MFTVVGHRSPISDRAVTASDGPCLRRFGTLLLFTCGTLSLTFTGFPKTCHFRAPACQRGEAASLLRTCYACGPVGEILAFLISGVNMLALALDLLTGCGLVSLAIQSDNLPAER